MNYLEEFRSIKTFIFDVDGVLTNSQLIILENGRLLRKMNTRDGFAIKEAIKFGFKVFIITGGSSTGVKLRLEGLGVSGLYLGIQEKMDAFEEIIDVYDIEPDEVLYMGDDIPDYEVMRRVGIPACPSDAAPEIKHLSRYISPKKGGEGCVRDVIEKVLKLNNKWLDPFILEEPE
jgi:3-deoxy-D-manno-octulosonate 8-phosphate phosphatase (KDO 8-P phosphatase)